MMPTVLFLMAVLLGASADHATGTFYNPATPSNTAPTQVQDTYEVAAAKQAFQQEFQRLAKLAEDAPDTHQYFQQQQPRAQFTFAQAPYFQQQPRATFTLDQAPIPVEDTYEVAAAKQAFQQEFQRLAKLAEDAPDTYQYFQQQPRATFTLGQAPMPVEDTYEVAAAKRAFQQEFQRSANLAAVASYN